jgi:hypothetical protein
MQYEQSFGILFNRNIHMGKLNSFLLLLDLHPQESFRKWLIDSLETKITFFAF